MRNAAGLEAIRLPANRRSAAGRGVPYDHGRTHARTSAKRVLVTIPQWTNHPVWKVVVIQCYLLEDASLTNCDEWLNSITGS